MIAKIDIDQEKSKIKALFNVLVILVVLYLCFLFFSVVSFEVVEIASNERLLKHLGGFRCDGVRFLYDPEYIFELYGIWWMMLLKSVRLMDVHSVLFVPFIVPIGVLFAFFILFINKNYSFGLWYVLNHHFAKFKDIEQMGLNKGMFTVLGRFANTVLSTKLAESVLCIGEMGTGKTSSVAIPSILRSDNTSIIAVDMTGLLPKYTSGHRSRIGEIFYYNWDLLDDADKGLFYPRWNPLSDDNMPKSLRDRDEYLKRIAGYLVDVEDDRKDNYWNLLAHSIIAAFLGYWVSKVSQAKANDYFLSKLIEKRHLSKDEKDVLLSYYIQMPKNYTKDVLNSLNRDELNKDNYLPIGSWAGVPEQWIGKDVCFAAITDWMINNYMTSHDDNSRDWKYWLEGLLREAVFFGYGNIVINGLRQFLFLSSKQRKLAFACVMKPFGIFTNQAIRERTNGNDFNLEDLRGVYNKNKKAWQPVTIYSLANTHASKILNQMFLDEVMYRNLHLTENKGPLPVMFVLDDVGHNLRLKNLTGILTASKSKKMSALLMCNSLSLVENTYSKEELECIVVNTTYKIIKAPNNRRLSHQLDKLATFATKSVQIPKVKNRKRLNKKYFANASYFHRLAMDFNLKNSIQIETKNHQIVLVEGYYNRPILADNIFFAEDEKFKSLAVLDSEYNLSFEKLGCKDKGDMDTPKLAEIFNQKDLGVDDLFELDQYMNVVFEEVSVELVDQNLTSEEVEDVTMVKEEPNSSIKDWWLEEDAFGLQNKDKENPFSNKK